MSAAVPVLVTAFNRPDLLRERLLQLRELHGGPLFISVDGPRAGVPGDAEAVADCAAVARGEASRRKAELLIRTENLGCRDGMIDGITWFFERVDAGVIVEDDIRLGPSFLPFCEALLGFHRRDPEIAMISGYVPGVWDTADPYLFGRVPSVWGWATWADRWSWMDDAQHRHRRPPSTFRFLRSTKSLQVANAARNHAAWAARGVDTWDFWWGTCVNVRGALVAFPPAPLVQNVGGDARATHTVGLPSTSRPADVGIPRQGRTPRVDAGIDSWILERRPGSGFDIRSALPPELLMLGLSFKRFARRIVALTQPSWRRD